MRIRWIVTYDVGDQKRLRKVYKLLRGYGDWLQLSVFRCDLTASERVVVARRLEEIIHAREDQVLFVRVGPVDGRGDEALETLGRPMEERRRMLVI